MQENVLESGKCKREPPDHPTLPHSINYCQLPGNVCCVLFDFVAEHGKYCLCFDQTTPYRGLSLQGCSWPLTEASLSFCELTPMGDNQHVSRSRCRRGKAVKTGSHGTDLTLDAEFKISLSQGPQR